MSKWRYEEQPAKVRAILLARGEVCEEPLITTSRKFLVGLDDKGELHEIDDLQTAILCGYSSEEWDRLRIHIDELNRRVQQLHYDYANNRFTLIGEAQ